MKIFRNFWEMPSADFTVLKNLDNRVTNFASAKWLARPFNNKSACRVLIYYTPGPISRSQIEPFYFHASYFKNRFGVEFRSIPIADLISRHDGPEADIIIIQPWFTVPGKQLSESLEWLKIRMPSARIMFFDSFAHNDLRLAQFIEPYIDLYYKKSLFKDRADYFKITVGDTNLSDYYCILYGMDVGQLVNWNVPEAIISKLRLSPSFFTLSRFAKAFRKRQWHPHTARPIDVQSRLGRAGQGWYHAMRTHASSAISLIEDIKTSPPEPISIKSFMHELKLSKLCFSPFGYGELCWRDIEAFETGAVLVKQDMSHLETNPHLYEAGVTYLPLKWDFSDLNEVIGSALSDNHRLESIADEAWTRVNRYIEEECFAIEMEEIFI